MSTNPIDLPGRTVAVLSLAEAPLPDALPFESVVRAWEEHARQVAAVTRRLLAMAATGELPELIAVRPRVTRDEVHVDIQSDPEGVGPWAVRLGGEVSARTKAASRGGDGYEYLSATVVMDGVTVRLCSCRWIPAAEWAAMQADASAVAL
ncbi:hypothetical protein ACIQNU_02565 [Streptomyces sp. NPDC091292]|uniref:hypothetical protein n=1 Tax=Streptomyces sp. NPDC091292 TaxID=3365991 RepID=UPI0038204074